MTIRLRQPRTTLLKPATLAFTVAALLCCGCSSADKSASPDLHGAAPTRAQVTTSTVGQEPTASAARESFEQASKQLHKTLAEFGYNTAEGDHAGPASEAFLAVPTAGGAAIRVGATWGVDGPQGSFENLGTVNIGDVKMSLISRLSVEGVWFECNGLLLELLSDDGIDALRDVLSMIHREMGC